MSGRLSPDIGMIRDDAIGDHAREAAMLQERVGLAGDNGSGLEGSIDEDWTPARVTPGNAIGCLGLVAAALAGPAMAVMGTGRLRRIGIALTAAEVTIVSAGVLASGAFE